MKSTGKAATGRHRILGRRGMFEKVVETEKGTEVMRQYMTHFIKPDYSPWNKEYDCPNLPWCYFKVNVEIFDVRDILKMNVPSEKMVYCHDERQKILYQATFKNVCDQISGLEPWEEVDLEIFDDRLNWTIAVTHEGEALVYGVEIL
jgi:hypothetical protein